jgi:glycosyltransferase involved in cell wall biosynthesis
VYNFRRGLIAALQAQGCEVLVVAPADGHERALVAAGCRFEHLPLEARGKNPLSDVRTLCRLIRIYRRHRIDAAFHFTIKPNIYGSLACRLLGIESVPTVTGMGNVFTREGLSVKAVRLLYRLAFSAVRSVFFQNDDDRAYFLGRGLVRKEQAELLPGSGVDTGYFAPSATGEARPGFVFLLVARLLWDKGVAEYVEAARRVRAEHPGVEFHIVGFVLQDDGAVPMEYLRAREDEGVIRYLGASDQVREHLGRADCVVLPSYYREGVPRVLLEAASMAKPVLTTDWIGCREAVDPGQTGILCRPRDVADLTAAMRAMLSLGAEERREMGERGRRKMIEEFDEKLVLGRYLAVLEGLRARAGR